ncbi:fimbrial protein [Proteus myxofaciens]|uniref:Type 1 fimbrial protein n=1 Tax=Proteus myxofaciens ATCC 19692 TaxID=1354337 RepID=A0A198GHZ1_9GAMM|nr:fimbrial protein [Proteus myxofaciens]OAT36728.1 type 1 fimbrial protein [Proteus myxofaciens ATCC 19692]
MKKLMLSLLILFSLSLQAGGANWKVELPGGEMRFYGELIAEACSVAISDQSMIVNMGQLSTNKLTAPGQDSDPIKFDIHLQECNHEISKFVSITFLGVANDINHDILSVDNGDDSAKGVGIAIFDSNNNLIPINSLPMKVALLNKEREMTLHFMTKYRATSYNIMGGKADAYADFLLTYE